MIPYMKRKFSDEDTKLLKCYKVLSENGERLLQKKKGIKKEAKINVKNKNNKTNAKKTHRENMHKLDSITVLQQAQESLVSIQQEQEISELKYEAVLRL